MQAVALSENAVALLRYRVKKWPIKVREIDLPAYRELVEAGVMAPDGDHFRFTEEGWAHREELLREAADRIERERFEPPDASNLSESAKDLLRRRLAGDREVTEANLPHYHELVAARIMIPIHSFIGGAEFAFHFTYWGWKRDSRHPSFCHGPPHPFIRGPGVRGKNHGVSISNTQKARVRHSAKGGSGHSLNIRPALIAGLRHATVGCYCR